MQVYLKMQNPFVVNDFKTVEDIANYLDVDEHNFRIDSNNLIHFSQPQVNQITSHIISKGHDGVIVNQGTWNEYVVFNPEQIKSVNNKGTFDRSNPNIYYQSETSNNIVDLTNEFEKTPTIDEVKNYINEIVENGTKFATLSPNWFVDIKGGAKKKAHIIKSSDFSKMNKSQKNRHNKYIMSLEKLLANAEYAGEKENTKKDKKPNIEKYHYFKTDVKIGNKTYQLIFDTEEYKNDKSSLSANVLRSVKNLNEDTNSINDNPENINPKTVHLYNIKEIKTPKTYFQSVYHGTPHKFDEFSLDAIGTGEGNQAHGYGLYFAENKDVSDKIYRKRLSGDKVFYDGKELHHQYWNANNKDNENYDWNEQWLLEVINEIIKVKGEKQISLKEAKKEFINEYPSKGKLLAFQKKKLEIAKNLDVSKIKTQKGQLFEADIPENDVLIDEQKDYKEQPEKVKNALIELVESEVNAPNYLKYNLPKNENINMDGRQIYNMLSRSLGGDKNASETLNKYGIKGITYDGYQDGRCYVIFDDKAVNILKTYYQESENENEKLIAGFTYPEVMEKLTALYEQLTDNLNSKEKDSLMAKIHILEDAFDISEHPDKFRNEEVRTEKMLNAYYVLNNQEIPKDYIEADALSKRSYKDLKNIHDKKKEEAESKYYGYFSKTDDKSIITIMANHNGSTALHEFGHLFLDMLVELAKVNEDARIQLDAVNKWLGYAGEYTTAQHEKFANNFVAYLYKGKAPNNKLRTVFENFKEWLKSVYNHILDIPNVDISDEVQELFDKSYILLNG